MYVYMYAFIYLFIFLFICRKPDPFQNTKGGFNVQQISRISRCDTAVHVMQYSRSSL